jgi:transposase
LAHRSDFFGDQRRAWNSAIAAATLANFVILEATGGLEVPVASALATVGIAVAIVNPRQVRNFARATGRLAKTDRLDAEVLARFGEMVKPAVRPLPDEQA